MYTTFWLPLLLRSLLHRLFTNRAESKTWNPLHLPKLRSKQRLWRPNRQYREGVHSHKQRWKKRERTCLMSPTFCFPAARHCNSGSNPSILRGRHPNSQLAPYAVVAFLLCASSAMKMKNSSALAFRTDVKANKQIKADQTSYEEALQGRCGQDHTLMWPNGEKKVLELFLVL